MTETRELLGELVDIPGALANPTPPLTLHDLRHTFATLALLDGMPSKAVAEVLGHSSTRGQGGP